jgi:DNA-binding transcriptional regulator GbsR (MarR family)
LDNPERREKLKVFFEEVGLMFDQMGMPRMAGRILGWLLVSDPAHQSAGQLTEVLGASKGSISTNTRLLIQWGMAEKVGVPGERSTYYRLSPDPISTILHMKTAAIRALREQMEKGLAIMADKPVKHRQRLQTAHDGWLFFEKEMPRLMERYRQQHKRGDAE